MGLFFPAALSLNSLTGGYNSNADFNSLEDNQTNSARNVELTRVNTIRKRNGYVRRLRTALTKNGLREQTFEKGERVKGYYQLIKQNKTTDVKAEVVAAGPNLYSYSSATASIIMTGLSDKEHPWFFEQIMAPDDGSDDVVVGVNGQDMPVIWNGTDNSASFLQDVPGSSGVVSGKFIASLFGRLYIANINDKSDVDASSKVVLSHFDVNGVPTPHVFPEELFFYVGGSDRYGPITGMASLNGELIIFKQS